MKQRLIVLLCALGVVPFAFATRYIDQARAYAACPDMSELCMSEHLAVVANEEGVTHMLGLARLLATHIPEFRVQCASAVRRIGTTHAQGDHKTREWGPSAAVCNYGFVHGIARELSSAGRIEDAVVFCEELNDEAAGIVPDIRAECVRGIGSGFTHRPGIFPGDAPAIAESGISLCKDSSVDERAYLLCISGVFNALGFDMVYGRNGLSVDPDDPLFACRQFADAERTRCEGNMKWAAIAVISDEKGIPPSVEDGYAAAKNRYAEDLVLQLVRTLAYDSARAGTPAKEMLDVCAALPPAAQGSCATGSALGLAKHGIPGREHASVVGFCRESAELLGVSIRECLRDPIAYLQGALHPLVMNRICTALDRSFSFTCVRDEWKSIGGA